MLLIKTEGVTGMDQQTAQRLEQWIDQNFDRIVEDIKRLVRIPSVSTYDEEGTPFGAGCKRALDEALAMAAEYGFTTDRCGDLFGSAAMRPGVPAGEEIAFWGHLDVVPPGDDWQYTQPYDPIEKGGYLIGRGADDNKGPAVGVMHLLRAFRELGIPTHHGLRLFFGCDEEHGMADVQHYAANFPPQKLTIIADCGFPVCYGEKGILEANIVSREAVKSLSALKAGMATNIVPDKAYLCLKGAAANPQNTQWAELSVHDGETCICGKGLSRHSAFPDGGVNAIHQAMIAALDTGLLTGYDLQVVDFLKRVNDDCWGTNVGADGEDEISGKTTCVGTMAHLTPEGRAVLHLNIRYCIRTDADKLMANMRRICEENGCELEILRDSAPNYFPRENPVVDALTGVFNEMTGQDRKPYVMGGGTYARKLKNALAFGPGGLEKEPTDLFAPGHGGAHQPDEGLHLASYKRALLILGMGILEADRVMAEQ